MTADKLKHTLSKLSDKERQNIQYMLEGGVDSEVRTHVAMQHPDAEIEPILHGFAQGKANPRAVAQRSDGGGVKRKRRGPKKQRQPKKVAVSIDAGNTASSASNRPKPPTPPRPSKGRVKKSSRSRQGRGERGRVRNGNLKSSANAINDRRKVSRRGISDGENSKPGLQASAQNMKNAGEGMSLTGSTFLQSKARSLHEPSRRVEVSGGGEKAQLSSTLRSCKEWQRKDKYAKLSVARSKGKKIKTKKGKGDGVNLYENVETDTTNVPSLRSTTSSSDQDQVRSETKKGPTKQGKKHTKTKVASSGWPELTSDELLNIPHAYDTLVSAAGEAAVAGDNDFRLGECHPEDDVD